MVRKITGIISVLVLIALAGAACTPQVSESDFRELQSEVQALNTTLRLTQQELLAAEDAVRNAQQQTVQLQNQLAQSTVDCGCEGKTYASPVYTDTTLLPLSYYLPYCSSCCYQNYACYQYCPYPYYQPCPCPHPEPGPPPGPPPPGPPPPEPGPPPFPWPGPHPLLQPESPLSQQSNIVQFTPSTLSPSLITTTIASTAVGPSTFTQSTAMSSATQAKTVTDKPIFNYSTFSNSTPAPPSLITTRILAVQPSSAPALTPIPITKPITAPQSAPAARVPRPNQQIPDTQIAPLAPKYVMSEHIISAEDMPRVVTTSATVFIRLPQLQ